MELAVFKKRAEAQYNKIGVKNFEEFVVKAGYSPSNKGKNFYRLGVSRRLIAFLMMIEGQADPMPAIRKLNS